MKILFALLFLSISAGAALPPSAKDPQYDEFEGLELAEALLKDGKPDEAERMIRDVGRNDRRTALLRGDIALAKGELKNAVAYFGNALGRSKGAEIAPLQLRIGEAQFRAEKWNECARAYEKAGEAVYGLDKYVIQKASCERKLKHISAAWATLWSGERTLKSYVLLAERVRLMSDLGLYQQALEESLNYLRRPDAKASEALSLAELQGANTMVFLEVAKLRFPGDTDILLTLVPLYYEKGLLRSVAETFERVSWKVKKYAYHAAEIYRQQGDLQKAYWLNLQVPDDKERLRQKLALLVDTSKWELIASLEPQARWSKVPMDDEVHYALAFSLARFGRLDAAKDYVAMVRSPSLIAKATSLAQVIQTCEDASWRCRH